MGGRGCVSSACSDDGWGSGARLAPLGGARGWDKEELVNHTSMMITRNSILETVYSVQLLKKAVMSVVR